MLRARVALIVLVPLQFAAVPAVFAGFSICTPDPAGVIPIITPLCSHDEIEFGAVILPPTRSLVPPGLEARTSIRVPQRRFDAPAGDALRASLGPCGVTAMCASFGAPQEDVTAWIGIPFQDGASQFFIATHGQPATHLGGGTYATPLWNKEHLWIDIDGSGVPLGLQLRYVLTDDDLGVDVLVVDYIGYTQPGVDYSSYSFGHSLSSLVVIQDSETGEVVYAYVALFDQNDDYVGDVDLEIGDQLQTYYLGFERDDPTVLYLFYIEELKPVTTDPEFFHAEIYPGEDFPCTYCDASTMRPAGPAVAQAATLGQKQPALIGAQTQFYFIFEAFGADRSTYTNPLPIVAAAAAATAIPTLSWPMLLGLMVLLAAASLRLLR